MRSIPQTETRFVSSLSDMKIRVKSEGKKFFFIVPNWLFINHLFCFVAHRELKKKGLDLPYRKLYSFFKEINRCKQRHKDWKLVELNSADGDEVEIKM